MNCAKIRNDIEKGKTGRILPLMTPLSNGSGTSGNLDIGNPSPMADGGGAIREIGDPEENQNRLPGGQAVFDLNIVHSRRRGRYAPRAF